MPTSALSSETGGTTQRRCCLIHPNILPSQRLAIKAQNCRFLRKGFNVYLSKLTGFLFAFVLLALSFVGASAQSKSNGVKPEIVKADDVPVLVMHLPDWENKVKEGVIHVVSLPALQETAGDKPALDAINFDGGTEGVTAKYGDARLIIVEFTTPQYATDNDARINERIAELRAAGQPVPSEYKRVGNYSVFVFDAPDAASADKLISGVKYEKDVRWLGRNPHAEEIATKAYTETMGSVIITTLITTGLAILLCLGVGGLIGGAIFLRRRAQHTAQEIYSDAGGMLRLNIEDLNAPRIPTAKLIGQNEE